MSTIAPPRSRTTATRRRATPRMTRPLGSYTDTDGHRHHILCLHGAHGTRLVIDRRADRPAPKRLIAHLESDEPTENAQLIADLYIAEQHSRACRTLTRADLTGRALTREEQPPVPEQAEPLQDRHGNTYKLQPTENRSGRPKRLRWLREHPDGSSLPVTLRDVVGALEAYEPARTLTRHAIENHVADPGISTCHLRTELDRLNSSRTVLNRALREAVLTATRSGELSLSEIALRCGQCKLANGNRSGDTSWLARRIGRRPEPGQQYPTPWIAIDTLTRIARDGLGIDPAEVEEG